MFKAFAILFLGILSVSLAAIFVRFCDDVPSLIIATYRLVIASTILNIIFHKQKKNWKSFNKKEILIGFSGGIFLSLHFITWFQSLKMTSVASSVVLLSTTPIFVSIFSYIFFKEKQEKEIIISILLAIAGTTILTLGDSSFSISFSQKALIGDLFAISGALFAALYFMVGSSLRKNLDTMSYIVLVYSFSAIILIFSTIISGLPITGYNLKSYIFMFLLAVVSQIFGHTAFNWALKYIKTSVVAITTLGEPVLASILAYFIFGESIDKFKLFGIFFVFTAIIIASRKGKR